MPERAALIGGTLVWSEVGAGTEVELRLPARIAYATSRRRSWLSRLLASKTAHSPKRTRHDRQLTALRDVFWRSMTGVPPATSRSRVLKRGGSRRTSFRRRPRHHRIVQCEGREPVEARAPEASTFRRTRGGSSPLQRRHLSQRAALGRCAVRGARCGHRNSWQHPGAQARISRKSTASALSGTVVRYGPDLGW